MSNPEFEPTQIQQGETFVFSGEWSEQERDVIAGIIGRRIAELDAEITLFEETEGIHYPASMTVWHSRNRRQRDELERAREFVTIMPADFLANNMLVFREFIPVDVDPAEE